MRIVIEIEDPDSDAMLRRQLADIGRRLEDADDSDGWAGLETAFKYFQVTAIIGVFNGSYDALLPYLTLPLEGKAGR